MRRRSIGASKRAKAQRRKTTARKSRVPTNAASPRTSSVAVKETAVARLTRQLNEAYQQQTATAEVLKVISRATFDLQTVLNTLVKTAALLCEADLANIWRPSGSSYHLAASFGIPGKDKERQANKAYLESIEIEPGRGSTVGRVLLEKRPVQISDVQADPDYLLGKIISIGDYRTSLGVPLMREGEPIGVITLMRCTVQPFTVKQIELVSTFANQAVIAIENARLFDEVQAKTRDLTEALTYQTGSANILKVIASSPTDVEPVLTAIVESACVICEAEEAHVVLRDGDELVFQVQHGSTPVVWKRQPINRLWVAGRAAVDRRAVHVHDLLSPEGDEFPDGRKLARRDGARTVLAVPLLREGECIGVIALRRLEVRPFSEKQIELLQTFADQAVIAIGNVRLFGEVQAKTHDLTEALLQQTATADVLKTISRSTVELETVLDTLVETVARLCRADQASMFRRRDDRYYLVAAWGFSAEGEEFLDTHPLALDRGSINGRVAAERRPVHIPDVLLDPEYTYREGQKLAGYRTMLGIPLLREETLVGIFVVSRTRVEPFTDKEIELATSFADQAVIAIENARLFEELRDRQAELRVTFDNMGDGVVMFGADTRLVAWNRNFQTILDLPDGLVAQRPTYVDYVRILAERGEFGTVDLEEELNRRLQDTDRELRLERTRPDGRVVEVRRNTVPGGGFVLIYSDITERKRAEEAIRAARDAAEKALRELQMAQASLVHAQKMAALGQVTAGIAHEIKNPLNFVNNFAGLYCWTS